MNILVVLFALSTTIAAAGTFQQDDQNDINSLMQGKTEVEKQMKSLYKNPSGALGSGAAQKPGEPQSPLPSSINLDKFKGVPGLGPLIENPSVEVRIHKMETLFRDTKYQNSFEELAKNPNLRKFYFALLIVSLVYFVVRSLILGHLETWWARLAARPIIFCGYLVGIWLVGQTILGQPFVTLLEGIKNVII